MDSYSTSAWVKWNLLIPHFCVSVIMVCLLEPDVTGVRGTVLHCARLCYASNPGD